MPTESLDRYARGVAEQLTRALLCLREGKHVQAGRLIEDASRCAWKIHNGAVHSRAQALVTAVIDACDETGRL